ncbi:hypothetical protein GCM10023080_093800 [Streptomyces pseudoechinosporeus]
MVRLGMLEAQVSPEAVRQLKEVLAAHPGSAEVRLSVRGRTRTTVYRLGYRVDARPEFWADVKAALAVTRVPGTPGAPGL